MSSRRPWVLPAIVLVGLMTALIVRLKSRPEPASVAPPISLSNVTAHKEQTPLRVRSQEPAPAAAAPVAASSDTLVREIFRWLNTEDAPDREATLRRLLTALIASDPVATARMAQAQPAGPARDTLLRMLAQIWANKDFASAIRWASTLSVSEERRTAFATACFEVAPQNPADAVDAWVSYSSEVSDPVVENLLQVWATKDPAAALTWARSRAPAEAHDRALARVAFVLAQNDPAYAASTLTELNPGPVQIEATMSVLHQWATRDLAGATQWARGFPAGPLADRAQAELAGMAQHAGTAAR